MKNICKPIFQSLGLLAFILAIYSCEDGNLQFIEVSKNNTLKEVRLGESNYYLNLPANFKLEEARGKEGQLGYHIIPSDSLVKKKGFIEIEYGDPIGNTYRGEPGKAFARSQLCDKKVKWIIYQSRDGSFNAYTDENGDLNADVSSMRRVEIDSMISWISTLHIK